MSWFVYVVRLERGVDRDRLIADLQQDGIPPALLRAHSLAALVPRAFGYRPGDFPVTERVARTTLALPFFTDMTEDQVNYVCERLAAQLMEQPL